VVILGSGAQRLGGARGGRSACGAQRFWLARDSGSACGGVRRLWGVGELGERATIWGSTRRREFLQCAATMWERAIWGRRRRDLGLGLCVAVG
jgi:hypothetical protein